jgi:hypothetical protein
LSLKDELLLSTYEPNLDGSAAAKVRVGRLRTGKPIRQFHGTADDIELIEPCRAYVARLQKAGAEMR